MESVSLLPVIADLAGAAIASRLAGENYEVLLANRDVLDLSDQRATENWLERARPDANFLAAGLVGGIHANNNYPADFVANNLAIALNVIRSAYTIGVKNCSAVGSSCIYQKYVEQPLARAAPRLRRSSYVKCTGASMAMIARSCPQTCTGQTTTITR